MFLSFPCVDCTRNGPDCSGPNLLPSTRWCVPVLRSGNVGLALRCGHGHDAPCVSEPPIIECLTSGSGSFLARLALDRIVGPGTLAVGENFRPVFHCSSILTALT